MENNQVKLLYCRCLHAASAHMQPGEPLQPAIVPASVYYLPGQPAGEYQYGRWSNPTWSVLEEALSVLEDAEAIVFPSGMAAIAAIFYAELKAGDRLLLPSDGYYTTRALAEKYLAPFDITVVTRPTANFESGDFNGFRMIWLETPSNPGLDICDIQSVAAKAHRAGALVAVDNTTLGPLGQRPLDLGADLTVSSDTKVVNGHSDALLAHVASRDRKIMARLRDWRKHSGAIPGPFECWMVHRGLETLDVRFERMCGNAERLAAILNSHPKVQSVRFPGLPNSPNHDLATRQMLRFGTMIGVTFHGASAAETFIQECRYIRPATSFGGLHTSAERRARWGDQVPEGFVRLSVGCEPTEVLAAEIQRVLDQM